MFFSLWSASRRVSDSSNVDEEGDGFLIVTVGKMRIPVFHLVVFKFHCVDGDKENDTTRWCGWARGVSGTLKFFRRWHLTKGQVVNTKTNAILGRMAYGYAGGWCREQWSNLVFVLLIFSCSQIVPPEATPGNQGSLWVPAPECSPLWNFLLVFTNVCGI